MPPTQNSPKIDGAGSRTEHTLTEALVTLCSLRFSIPAPCLTLNHQIILSVCRRQPQYFGAFRAVFFTKQELKMRKEVYSDAGFLISKLHFSVCIDSSPSPLQQNTEGDGVWTRKEEQQQQGILFSSSSHPFLLFYIDFDSVEILHPALLHSNIWHLSSRWAGKL